VIELRGLVTLLKIIRALQMAEQIKRSLSYCQVMRERGCCFCVAGELCQTALAEATGITKEAIRQFLERLEFIEIEERWNPIHIRRISDVGNNFPRKFIRLKDVQDSSQVKLDSLLVMA
jgi:hypothetical protein